MLAFVCVFLTEIYKPSQLEFPTKSTSKKTKKEDHVRLRALNGLLYKALTDLLCTPQVSQEIYDLNVELSKVAGPGSLRSVGAEVCRPDCVPRQVFSLRCGSGAECASVSPHVRCGGTFLLHPGAVTRQHGMCGETPSKCEEMHTWEAWGPGEKWPPLPLSWCKGEGGDFCRLSA